MGESDDTAIGIKDKTITHHVIDRPKNMIPSSFYDGLPKNREFIQPQWILDSSNFLVLLPPSKYAIGEPLPPHLSPWVNDDEEGYKPKYKEDIERFKNGEIVEDDATTKKELNENTQVVEQSNSDSNNEENNTDEEEEEEEEEVSKTSTNNLKEEEEETKALAKLMMSKKAKRLYGRMQHGIEAKQASVQSLERKRKEIDATRKDKSYLKQKVERLKDDRKVIEKEYERSSGSMKKKNKKIKK